MLLAGTDAILLYCENSSIALKSAAEFPYGALWLFFFFVLVIVPFNLFPCIHIEMNNSYHNLVSGSAKN